GRCLDVVRVLRITQGAPAVEAVALSCQGVLEALRGRTDAAKRMIALSRKMVEELGISHRLYEADVFAGRIDLLEGNAEAAQLRLRGAYDGLRDLGLGIDAARAAALLARALLALGRAEEAEALSHESEILAGDDLQAAIAWRGVRAEALAKRGDHAAAVELAQASVAIAAATDALLDHADARLALAAALRASGRAAEADAEEKRAIELWEAKGATLLAERARGSAATTAVLVAKPDANENQTSVTESRRVHDNAATRNATAFSAAIRTRNASAAAGLLADDLVVVHHPTGSTYDKACFLRGFPRSGDGIAGLAFEWTPLAGLGETLGLGRSILRGDSLEREDGASFGAFELNACFVVEVDGEGRRRHLEVFAADHLDQAIVCLYQRHAAQLSEGPTRVRAEAIARSVQARLGDFRDWDDLAPDVVSHDHRLTGYGERHGAAALIESFEALNELTSDLVWRIDDIVYLGENLLSMHGTNLGTDKRSGGPFERAVRLVWTFRDDGLLDRWEVFESEDTAAVLARIDELLAARAASQLPARPLPASPRVPHAEVFEPKDVSGALARLDELTGVKAPEAAATCFANVPTRLNESFVSAWAARDWDAVVALHSGACVIDDRRPLLRFEGSAEMTPPWLRTEFEVSNSRWTITPLATRGEKLALSRLLYEGEAPEGGGPFAQDRLCIDECDAAGRIVSTVLFGPDDLDAALTELDARWEAGEGAALGPIISRCDRGIAEKNWGALTAVCGPNFVEYDHRSLAVLGTTIGAQAWVQNFITQLEIAPDTRLRHRHVRANAHGLLFEFTWEGTQDGGAYEMPMLGVAEVREPGRMDRVDIYDPEQFGQAMARFEELRDRAGTVANLPRVENSASRAFTDLAPGGAATSYILPLSPYDNLASLAFRAMLASWGTGGEATGESAFTDDFRYSDRRHLLRLELDLDAFRRFSLDLSSMPSRNLQSSLLATRGERLCLVRLRVEVGSDDVGPSEIEHLNVVEVNAGGSCVALVRLDLDDLDAAYAELESRFQGGEAAKHPRATATINRYGVARDNHQWADLAAQLHPDMVTTDHRVLGWGMLLGRDEYMKTQKTLVDLAPDSKFQVHHVRRSERGQLAASVLCGTRDGGRFELPNNAVMELDSQGLIGRIDIYDSEDHEGAFARFRSIDGPAESGPLAAFPQTNAATEAMARYRAAVDAGDWDAVRAMLRTDAAYEDRRGRVPLSGGVEHWLEDERLASEGLYERTRRTSRVIGVFGKRICVESLLWSAEPDDGKAGVEILVVTEVDEDGRLVRSVDFGPEQRRDAQREALNRWIAIDPDAPIRAATLPDICEAFDRHDADGSLALFGSEFTLDDHRLAGLGRIDNADAYAESLKVLWDLAPDQTLETGWFFPAYDSRGWITTIQRLGNVPDGGAFESMYLSVMAAAADGTRHVEFFDLEAFDAAFACYERARSGSGGETQVAGRETGMNAVRETHEPAPDRRQTPRNAATLADAKLFKTHAAQDWEGLRPLVCEDFRFEDRGKRALVDGDFDTWLKSMQFIRSQPGVRFEHELLATLGERILIGKMRWIGESEDAEFLTDKLRLVEVAADGRLRRIILFDGDDRAAAFAEGIERFAAGEAAGADGTATYPAFVRALLRFDWTAMREVLSADFVFDDRRPLSLGILDADQWIASLRVQVDMAPDLANEASRVLAWSSHGYVLSVRTYGSL
ncbi:MAG: nuclear transport factor 2 family protein, partial [Candidatus Binatia bacterium]